MSAEMAILSQMIAKTSNLVAKANNLTHNDVVTTVEIESDVSIGDKLYINKSTGKLLSEEDNVNGEAIITAVTTSTVNTNYYTDQNDRKLQYGRFKISSSGDMAKVVFVPYNCTAGHSVHTIAADAATVGTKVSNTRDLESLPIQVPAVSSNGMWSITYSGSRYGDIGYYKITSYNGDVSLSVKSIDGGNNQNFIEPQIDIKSLRGDRCLFLYDSGSSYATRPSDESAILATFTLSSSGDPIGKGQTDLHDVKGVDNATFLPVSIRIGNEDSVYLFHGAGFKKITYTSLTDYNPDTINMEYNSDIAASIDYVWMYQKGNYYIDYDATEVFSYDRANGQFLLMKDNQLSFIKYDSVNTTPSFPEKISIDKIDDTSYAIYSAYNGKHEFWKVTLDNNDNTYTCSKLGSLPFSEEVDESYRMYRFMDCTVTTKGIVGTARVNTNKVESCNIPITFMVPDTVKVNAAALENGNAGATIQVISDTTVYSIDTGTPGQEYMNKYIQTSTNKLLMKG